jgi:hypothetical protein
MLLREEKRERIAKNGRVFISTWLVLKCDICDIEFSKQLGQGHNYGNHYCGRKCYNKARLKGGQADLKTRETKLERYNNENFLNRKKQLQTKLEKYGDENYNNRDKAKKTSFDRYGVAYPLQSKEIQVKQKKTNLERYSVEFVNQLEEHREKAQKTKLEKYGDENYNNHKKSKQTKLEKYGDENYNNRKKSSQTCLELYGSKSPLESREILDKIKETNLKRYGFENHSSNAEQQKKLSEAKTGMKYEDYVSQLPEFENYKRLVTKVTNQQPIHLLENFNKNRGKSESDYQLDHMFSKREGFLQNIDPEIIGNICNLKFIPARENISKGKDCSISKEVLAEKYNKEAS